MLIFDDRLADTIVTGAVFQGLGSPTLLCILGSRIVFNLKEAAEHGVNVGTNWASYQHSALSAMQFDEPHIGGAQHEYVTIRFEELGYWITDSLG